MAEITSAHDLLFRQLLSSRETARDLLRSYLPEPVHACLNLDSLEATGRTRWHVSTDFSALIRYPTELAQYTPRFGYALLDLSLKAEAELRGEAILRATLLAMRHAFDDDLANRIPSTLSLLAPVLATRTGLQALEALLRYFSAVGKRVDEHVLRDAVKQVIPAEGDAIMATLAERWMKDGLEQGLQQGLQQGSLATAQKFLLEVLDARFGSAAAPLHERVRRVEDLTVLSALLKTAATAESPEAFGSVLDASTRR